MAQAVRIQEMPTQVLVASVRGTRHVAELARLGVAGFTMPLPVLLDLVAHPMTSRGHEQFMADWDAPE